MTRLSIATTKGASGINPITLSYDRNTKDGTVSIITMLTGTHFNERIDGIVTESSVGNIANDSIGHETSKLTITANSTDETLAKKIATHSTFMYFWADSELRGNCELAVDTISDISPGIPHTHSIRYVFEDLSTKDKLIVEFIAGSSFASLKLIEEVDGSETILAQFDAPAGVKSIDWKVNFLNEGITKFFYQTPTGVITRLFTGTLKAKLGECKVGTIYSTTETTTRTVKTDFHWIFYKTVFISYDTSVVDRNSGIIKVFDTDGQPLEADWIKVFSKDHVFTGERIVENGLIRMIFKSDPKIEVYGWNDTAQSYNKLGDIIPQNNLGENANVQHEVILFRFSDSQIRIIAKYGIVDYLIDLKKGDPYLWIKTNSTRFRVETSKERFALSSDDFDVNLTKWNQKGTDDVNRGNPLGTYQGATNPQIFTNDSNADTGLEHVDDNWFAFYDLIANEVVGWIGCVLLPKGLQVKAVDDSTLEFIEFTFNKENIITFGMLESQPTLNINGIPKPFNVKNDDEYVKWRSNESVYTFAQKPFIKRRR